MLVDGVVAVDVVVDVVVVAVDVVGLPAKQIPHRYGHAFCIAVLARRLLWHMLCATNEHTLSSAVAAHMAMYRSKSK